MARFPQQLLDRIQAATDIVSLIEESVPLKRKGSEFVGLCPFHNDSSPSMHVSPTKQIYKCFSCGAGGTAFKWLMEYERLSFQEAVARLAKTANIVVELSESDPRIARDQDQILEANTIASALYSRCLLEESEGRLPGSISQGET